MTLESARILIVDDNIAIHNDFRKVLTQERVLGEMEFKSLERELFSGEESDGEEDAPSPVYQVESAYQGQEALEMVRRAYAENRPYSVVFMDVRMPPGWDGIQTISTIWEHFPEVEMVICTAYSDYSWEKIIEKLGTTDRLLFLRKPFDTTAVKQMALSLTRKWHLQRQAADYVTKLENEIKERKKSEEQLDFLAHHDSLTGLANRTQFQKKLHASIERARRLQQKLCVFLVDIDRFKEINDTLGHENGDVILKQVAMRLSAFIGSRGMVARLSGDEFSVVLEDVRSRQDVEARARGIHGVLEPLFEVDELQLELQASIGIVLFPDHGEDVDRLMRRADITVTEAKRTDSRLAFFDDRLDHYSPRRLTLLGELRRAIQNDDLLLHFQPKVRIQAREVDGFEALVRWRHPLHGVLSPGEFIPPAERSGLIKPLSLWVLGRVARSWVRLRQLGFDLTISVNLSARELLDVQLPRIVREILEEEGMDPSSLILEITESAIMEDPSLAKTTLSALSDMGMGISIDDFGTGYSSLSYLKNLPVSELKIDRSFVRDMQENPEDVRIVEYTIAFGHTLGLKVVAEGVEAQVHLDLLGQMGCDVAQGFFVGVPAPFEETLTWLKHSSWSKEAEGE